uniref:Uncharacterized protein n=1 Tax=Rhizophora mucronata TaxID=61149 RepID=A0A2P2M0F6_RHIMU
MPNIFAGAVYQQRQKFSTMRSLPFLSPLSLACLYEDTVQIMNGTSTSSRVCTIHFLAKNSVFFGSKRNPVESSFLSFRNKLCLPRRCPLNSASQPSSSDRGHVVVEDDLEAFLKVHPCSYLLSVNGFVFVRVSLPSTSCVFIHFHCFFTLFLFL